MIDIDFFKRINDQYGHPAGDRALRTLAQQIGHCVREMDLVARYGGEEFAVILPSTGPNDARNTAERIRHSIASKTWQFDEHQFNITVSVGIATAMNGDEVSMLVRRADTALYAANRGGRNQSSFHDGAQCRLLGTTDESSENFIATTGSGEPADEIKKSKILIVDDEPSTLLMVKKLLKDVGYSNVYTESQSVRAVGLIEKELPDLVLLDIRMPEVNGLEVLQRVRENEKTKHIPIVFLTSTTETETKIQALDLGANDFLQKPINKSEVVARVRNSLLAKAHVDHLAHYSIQLEHEVQLRTAELYASRREAIQCLARAAEIRDDETGQHVVRVGRYAAILAKEMGFSNERVIWLEHAAQLHDVGKIGVPDEILKKPSKLSEEEFEVMRQHCQVGSQIIRDDGAPDSAALKSHANLGASIFDNCNSPVMRMAAVVAESHHEKWDGTGYPNGLAEENIPIEGRITAVADVFDALSTKRHYKSAIPLGECFSIINDGKGKHFDPDVVDAFLRRKIDILEVFYAYNEDQAASDHQGTTQISE